MEKYKACPSKNLNIEKSWDLVIFALIFSEFGYVPDFCYVFLKNQGKPTFFHVQVCRWIGLLDKGKSSSCIDCCKTLGFFYNIKNMCRKSKFFQVNDFFH